MNNKVVIWSGGWDSTLVLFQELEESKQAEAWSFTMPGISTLKMESEKISRKRFMDMVQTEHPEWKLTHRTIDLIYDWEKVEPSGNFPQQVSWVTMASIFAPNNTDILFGFIHGDHYWRWEHDLKKASEHICNVMAKKVNLCNPLVTFYKAEVVKAIYNLGLENYCWTCENPQILMQPCGICNTCWAHKVALEECKMRGYSLEKEELQSVGVKALDDPIYVSKDAE